MSDLIQLKPQVAPPDTLRVTIDYNVKTGAVSVQGPAGASVLVVAGMLATGTHLFWQQVDGAQKSSLSI